VAARLAMAPPTPTIGLRTLGSVGDSITSYTLELNSSAHSSVLRHRNPANWRGRSAVDEKKMFGGLAFMLNGNMCCGIIRDDLMVRVGPEQYADALAQPHACELDFTGRPMRGLIVVDAAGLTSDANLETWVRRGVAFVTGLPAK